MYGLLRGLQRFGACQASQPPDRPVVAVLVDLLVGHRFGVGVVVEQDRAGGLDEPFGMVARSDADGRDRLPGEFLNLHSEPHIAQRHGHRVGSIDGGRDEQHRGFAGDQPRSELCIDPDDFALGRGGHGLGLGLELVDGGHAGSPVVVGRARRFTPTLSSASARRAARISATSSSEYPSLARA